MAPAYFITTLGCPKNQADSREMERSLLSEGFTPVTTPESADVHIINTCAFILDAREETIENIFDAAGVKETVKDQKLVLTGCFSQRYPDAVRDELPEVDLFFGVGEFGEAGKKISTLFAPIEKQKADPQSVPYTINPPWAPLKVSDGCSRSCSFCAIPQIRGPFSPLSSESILQEIGRLVKEGIRELDIVSQDTGYYGSSPEEFLDLLEQMEAVPDISWIRLLYLYPDEKARRILRGIKERGFRKIVPYLESPVQHVSERILKSMGRSGNRLWFKEFFQEARDLFPGLEIRTTFLLGYPGETEADVEEIIAFLNEVKPEKLALFAYSPEEGTPAFKQFGESQEAAAERINRVRETHLAILKEIHAARIGKSYQCMVDEINPEGTIVRRAQDAPESDEIVHLPVLENVSVGDIVSVQITGFFEYDMTGTLRTGDDA